MKIRYFYIRTQSDDIQGPFTASTLDKMYNEHRMSGQTMISPDKINWKTLEEYLYPVPAQEEEIPAEQEIPQAGKTEEKPEEPTKAPAPLPEPHENKKEEVLRPIFVAEEDPVKIMGNTLQLIWNTPDKLKELGDVSPRNVFSKVLPVSFFFSILLTLAAVLSVANFYGGLLQKTCFIVGFMLCNMLFVFLELLCFQNQNEPSSEFMKKVTILSGMLWINFSSITCIGFLQLGMIALPSKTPVQEWCIYISNIFVLFCTCFFISNIGIGLRTGLCSFFSCRPRTTVCFSAFILSQYCGIIILAFLIAEKCLYN